MGYNQREPHHLSHLFLLHPRSSFLAYPSTAPITSISKPPHPQTTQPSRWSESPHPPYPQS
jgi:hypothetical protein